MLEPLSREAIARPGLSCTIEHLVPVAMGGSIKNGNVGAACQGCNCARGTGERHYAERFEAHLLRRKYVVGAI